MADRLEAQRRADRIREFRAELGALRAEGATPLTSEQETVIRAYHDALLERYAREFDIDSTERSAGLSRGLQAASFFGAVTLTAALWALVARFWGRLDLPVQIGLLTFIPLALLGAVDVAARRERSLYVASLFALAAYGAFWLAAIAVPELLDLPLTPGILWTGALFGVALAVPYGFRLVFGLALVALVVAVSASVFAAVGAPWTIAAERLEPAVLTAFSLVVAARAFQGPAARLAPVARLVGLFLGLGGLFVLSSTAAVSQLPLPDRVVEGIYQAAMFAASAATLGRGLAAGRAEVAQTGGAFLTLFLLARYVDWFWTLLPRYLFFLILAAMAFAVIATLQRLRARARRAGGAS
ncbi:MAG: hypothetical protein AB1635_19420 [Acidobacteriota bacterium]